MVMPTVNSMLTHAFEVNGLRKNFIGYFYCSMLTAVPEAAKGEDRCCL